MARIAIIVGHARHNTFCEALGRAYRRGALAAGHDATLFVTSAMTFDPVLHEGFERVQPLEDDLKAAHDAMLAADHLVIIFPLWLGTLPAILKGFLERVMQGELVEAARQRKWLKVLKGKSCRIVVTMGMPGFIYRWWFGAYAVKMLKRNILGFVGAGPIHTTIYGNVDGVTAEQRRAWIDRVEDLGRRAA
ncbi:MAG: NAD(P)H-dependent oxidoreductase [Bradyrhizobiaceae bacterium]|nr:NAD(P)H-dependent oxidoreductase [Bradyrhizobiaceae bacterium]